MVHKYLKALKVESLANSNVDNLGFSLGVLHDTEVDDEPVADCFKDVLLLNTAGLINH